MRCSDYRSFSRFRTKRFGFFCRILGRQGIYRSQNKMIAGVCRGLADYCDIPVVWIRLAGIIALIFTGFWPVGVIYIAAAIIIPKKEERDALSLEEENDVASDHLRRTAALSRLKERFSALECRIRTMEGIVTSKDFSWKQRLGSRGKE
ncbi:MAG: envelope stress response membrane protein PspC [Chitinivibrionales bacterium]|nr:envelope stress response membrane protein PspC [Chitinivibrionales bacterium]